jgi:tetratricopeptide (TPR) repeat protein
MKLKGIAALLASAGILAMGTLAFSASRAERPASAELLLAPGAFCGANNAQRPALLGKLVLAQAETAPFKPTSRSAKPAAQDASPPLYQDLGPLHFKISTSNPNAQAYFNQGVRLMYGFNHAEAGRAFREAWRLDPRCAMCYWGEAMVLGPNINLAMPDDAGPAAVAAAAKASANAAGASPVEQALIKAVVTRYQAPASRARLDVAYADAMRDAAKAFPNDDNVQVLYAESIMDLSPWDYWEAAGTVAKGRSGEMVDALERVLERNPLHPGAEHLYIHAMEASSQPDKALPAARLLAQQTPGAGHMVHMPSHIYYRVGLYKEALQSNVDAIAIDEKYFQQQRSDDVYKGAYYPHNIHFAMVSALMGGAGKEALDAAAKLDQSLTADMVKAVPGMQTVKAAPYFSHVQFSRPDSLIALPDPGRDLVLVQAMWHYARATGYARKQRAAEAQKEIDALMVIENGADLKALVAHGVPANVVTIARIVATGRLADARGDLPGAIKAYREAVPLQDGLPYDEPPKWYYPVRQSLGAALLRAGQLDEAEIAFRTSFAKTPSNGWALRGLMEVYRQRGDQAALAATRKRFDTTWLGKPGGPELSAL